MIQGPWVGGRPTRGVVDARECFRRAVRLLAQELHFPQKHSAWGTVPRGIGDRNLRGLPGLWERTAIRLELDEDRVCAAGSARHRGDGRVVRREVSADTAPAPALEGLVF